MSADTAFGPHKIFCRLCLRNTETSINLFEGKFQQIILELTSLEISDKDPYPTIACIKCIEDIQNAYKTRERILESHKKLTHAFNEREDVQPDVDFYNVYETTNLIEFEELEVPLNEETFDFEETAGLINFVIKTEETISVHDDSSDIHDITEIDDELKNETCEQNKYLLDCDTVLHGKKKIRNGKVEQSLRQNICEECNAILPNDRRKIYAHKQKHKKAECEICGILIRADNMKRHVENHESKSSICDYCGKTCGNMNSLKDHIRYNHVLPPDRYKCDQCSKSYRQKPKLDIHKLKVHKGSRTIGCPICPKKFFLRIDLKNHINNTHKKLRPHICTYCEKGFSSRYGLKTHLRQHTNETPFKCSECGSSFRQRVSLRTHLKSQHQIEENKDISCEFCEKSFISEFALKVHLRLHSGNSYKCDECKEYFDQSMFLLKHLKISHNIEEKLVDLENFRV